MSSISKNQLVIPTVKNFNQELSKLFLKKHSSSESMEKEKTKIVQVFKESFSSSVTTLKNVKASTPEEKKWVSRNFKMLSKELELVSQISDGIKEAFSPLLKEVSKLRQALADQDKPNFRFKVTFSGAHVRTIRTVVITQRYAGSPIAKKEFEFSLDVSKAVKQMKEVTSNRLRAQYLFSYYTKKREFFFTFEKAKKLLDSYEKGDKKGKEKIDELNNEYEKLLNELVNSDNSDYLLSSDELNELRAMPKNLESFSEENLHNLSDLINRRFTELKNDLEKIHQSIPSLFSYHTVRNAIEYLEGISQLHKDNPARFKEDQLLFMNSTRLLDCYGLARAEKIMSSALTGGDKDRNTKILSLNDLSKVVQGLGNLLESTLRGDFLVEEKIASVEPEDVLAQWYKVFSNIDSSQLSYDLNMLLDEYLNMERKKDNHAKILVMEFLLILKTKTTGLEELICKTDSKKFSQTELTRKYGTLSYILHKHIEVIQKNSELFKKIQADLDQNFLLKSERVTPRSPRTSNVSFDDEVGPSLGKGRIDQIAKKHAEALFQRSAELLAALPLDVFYSKDQKTIEGNQEQITAFFNKLDKFALVKCLEITDLAMRAEMMGYFLLVINDLLDRGDLFLSYGLSMNNVFMRETSFEAELKSLKKDHKKIFDRIKDLFLTLSRNNQKIKDFQKNRVLNGEFVIPGVAAAIQEVFMMAEEANKKAFVFQNLVVGESLLREVFVMHYWLMLNKWQEPKSIISEIDSFKSLDEKAIENLIITDKADKARKKAIEDAGKKSKSPSPPKA